MWSALQSRTIWVALVGVLFTVLNSFKVLPAELTQDQVVNAIYGVVLVLVIIFRKNAKVNLS